VIQSTTPETTLPGLAVLPSLAPKVEPGEPVTLATLEKRAKVISRVDQALRDLDAQLKLNGDKGKAKIVLTLEVEAQGFARHVGINVETKAAKLAKWETFINAKAGENGAMTVDDTLAPPKKGRSKKAKAEEAKAEADPVTRGIPAEEFNAGGEDGTEERADG
jgi:hypothetical protein